MSSNTARAAEAKAKCAEALSKVLADTYLLYLKTHNYH
jgi:starvation-inducible DNA-binding protein